VHYAEVELLGVPRDRLGDVGDADAGVFAFHRGERARRLGGRERGRHAQLRYPSAGTRYSGQCHDIANLDLESRYG
jgi:hypothetical protein